jgi:SulP family sulfate permease
MRRMSETSDVSVIYNEIDISEDADMQAGNLENLTIPKGVEVYEINGPYFFGAGNRAEEMMQRFGNDPKVRIIRMRKVPFIDSTGLHNLENLCLMSKKENVQIVLSGVNPKVQAVLHRAGFDAMLGQDNICSHINVALERAGQLLPENDYR